jgi:hypothetical protein
MSLGRKVTTTVLADDAGQLERCIIHHNKHLKPGCPRCPDAHWDASITVVNPGGGGGGGRKHTKGS